MQAVILAAGHGKRLRPLTLDYPKPMVRIGGKPILEHTLGMLPHEIDEVILVIGYKGDVIKEYFGYAFCLSVASKENGIKLTYVEQKEPRGTGHALLIAKPHLKNAPFLLLGGDDLFHPEDLRECVESKEPLVLVKRSQNPERFGVCVTDEQGRLVDLLEKRENPPSDMVSTGAFLLNHEIFEVPIPPHQSGELYLAEQVGSWAKRRPVYVLEARFWYPINNHEEFKAAEEIIKRGEFIK